MVGKTRCAWAFLLLSVAGCGECGGGPATLDEDGGPGSVPKHRLVDGEGERGGIPIHAIQGAGHRSPLEGAWVSDVEGVVTASGRFGFYLQAPPERWDDDPATSEALFVYTRRGPAAAAGDRVAVAGLVEEYVPGGEDTGNLPTTELVDPQVTLLARGVPLPPPVPIGARGRRPPGAVVDEGAPGSVLEGGAFDPDRHAIDFFESLEGMRVRIDGAEVVGPAIRGEELAVVPPGTVADGERTVHGGLRACPADPNPERWFVHVRAVGASSGEAPAVTTGDALDGPVDGVVGYRYGHFVVHPLGALPSIIGGATLPEPGTDLRPDAAHATFATLNAHNLSLGDGPRIARLGGLVVAALGSPDVLALQEVQDDNGPARGELSAELTLDAVRRAIREAGGPDYAAFDVPPEAEDADGGQPGSNIRVAFLLRTDRVRPSAPPARLAPADPAWIESRKPLVMDLLVRGRPVHVVQVHFASRRGDAPLFGAAQPPPSPTAAVRLAQARVVAGHVRGRLAADPDVPIVVLGDFNAPELAPALRVLGEAGLSNPLADLPPPDRYTYVYRGSSQALDHVLVSPSLAARGAVVDVVHRHADFPAAGRLSDHDPVVVRVGWP